MHTHHNGNTSYKLNLLECSEAVLARVRKKAFVSSHALLVVPWGA